MATKQKQTIQLHLYRIICKQIEEAAAHIGTQLFAHRRTLTSKSIPDIVETIEREIMRALDEVIDFRSEERRVGKECRL